MEALCLALAKGVAAVLAVGVVVAILVVGGGFELDVRRLVWSCSSFVDCCLY